MRGVTAVHLGVTKTSGGPEFLDPSASQETHDPVPLLLALEGDLRETKC